MSKAALLQELESLLLIHSDGDRHVTADMACEGNALPAAPEGGRLGWNTWHRWTPAIQPAYVQA